MIPSYSAVASPFITPVSGTVVNSSECLDVSVDYNYMLALLV